MRCVATVLLTLGGSLAFVGGVSALQAPSTPQPLVVPAPITDGPTLFHERGCAQCHTIRGTGGHKGPDLSGVGRRLKDPAIERQIVHGGNEMPPFGDALSAQEIEALVKYLHRCRARHPQPRKNSPAGVVGERTGDDLTMGEPGGSGAC